ncbi:unnamed protein product, partial [Symbiodinium microadriaticum]
SCDSVYDNSSWAFCGRTGGQQEEFHFTIRDGECLVGIYGDVDNVCDDALLVPQLVAENVVTPLPAPPSSDETGLYITIYDQFGDGWPVDVTLSYYLSILDDSVDSGVVHTGLYSNVTASGGMIHPNLIAFDQRFYFSLGAYQNSSGLIKPAPAYYWEIHWSIQLFTNGVLSKKYYDNNFRRSDAYFAPFTHSGALANSDVASGADIMNTTDFLETGWYITDIENMTLLYAYGKPYCDASYDAADGEYIFRVTGANDPDADLVSWDFCGTSGDTRDE